MNILKENPWLIFNFSVFKIELDSDENEIWCKHCNMPDGDHRGNDGSCCTGDVPGIEQNYRNRFSAIHWYTPLKSPWNDDKRFDAYCSKLTENEKEALCISCSVCASDHHYITGVCSTPPGLFYMTTTK